MTFAKFVAEVGRIAALAALVLSLASCGGLEISNGKGKGSVSVDANGAATGSVGVEFDFGSISSMGGADEAPQAAQPAKAGEVDLSLERPGFGKNAFAEVAPDVVDLLMDRFAFTSVQAAGVVGNLAYESAGFTAYQETTPIAGRGGAGWAQWTGPRRRSFEAWSVAEGLNPYSFQANWGFLVVELTSTHASTVAAVRKSRTLEDAMKAFEVTYERAGVKNYASRTSWSRKVLAAWTKTKTGT